MTKTDEEYKQKIEANKDFFIGLLREGRSLDRHKIDSKKEEVGDPEINIPSVKKLIESDLGTEMFEFLKRIDYRTIPIKHGFLGVKYQSMRKEINSILKNGPSYYHKNVPVYEVDTNKYQSLKDSPAFIYQGRIFISAETPKEFRKTFAEHELGEAILGHSIGNLMEIEYSIEQGNEEEYQEYRQKIYREAFGERDYEIWMKKRVEYIKGLKKYVQKKLSLREKRVFNRFLSDLRKEIKSEKNLPQLLEYEPK